MLNVLPLLGNQRFFRALQRVFLVYLMVLNIAGPALSRPEHELRRSVITVIKGQIEAFRQDDGNKAFSYASPDVQEQYGTADVYLQEFATAYKAVYRPKSVTFLNLATSGGRLVQRVLLLGPDGKAVVALFPMVQMEDGSWRVDGCVLVPVKGKQADIGSSQV